MDALWESQHKSLLLLLCGEQRHSISGYFHNLLSDTVTLRKHKYDICVWEGWIHLRIFHIWRKCISNDLLWWFKQLNWDWFLFNAFWLHFTLCTHSEMHELVMCKWRGWTKNENKWKNLKCEYRLARVLRLIIGDSAADDGSFDFLLGDLFFDEADMRAVGLSTGCLTWHTHTVALNTVSSASLSSWQQRSETRWWLIGWWRSPGLWRSPGCFLFD